MSDTTPYDAWDHRRPVAVRWQIPTWTAGDWDDMPRCEVDPLC